jgi:hypothetical protein
LAFYGREVSPKAILTGQVAAPLQAQTFLAAVRDAEKQSKKQSHLLDFEWKIDLTVQSSEISKRCG